MLTDKQNKKIYNKLQDHGIEILTIVVSKASSKSSKFGNSRGLNNNIK